MRGRTSACAVAVTIIAASATIAFVNRHSAEANSGMAEPTLTAARVSTSSGSATVGYSYVAPTQGAQAADLTAQQALDAAWKQSHPPTQPTSATATLATVSWNNLGIDGDVWFVTYAGTCVPVFGPPSPSGGASRPSCFDLHSTTVIDAHSGQRFADFVAGDDPIVGATTAAAS